MKIRVHTRVGTLFLAAIAILSVRGVLLAQAPQEADLVALRKALSSEDAGVRFAACEKLWQVGAPGAIPLVPDLALRLRDDDVSVRRMAGRVLLALGSDAVPAMQAIRKGLFDDDARVRVTCAECAWRFGMHSEPMVNDLVMRLERSYREFPLIRACLEALRPFSGQFRENPEPFYRWLAAKDVQVAGAAGRFFKSMFPPGDARERLLDRSLADLKSERGRDRGRAGALLELFDGKQHEQARRLYAYPPGDLAIAFDRGPDHLTPGESASWAVRAKNVSDHPFWVNMRELHISTIRSSRKAVMKEIAWGGALAEVSGMSMSHGDSFGPIFPLEPYRLAVPGVEAHLAGGPYRVPEKTGWITLAMKTKTRTKEGPYGIKPWIGQFAVDAKVWVVEKRHWANSGITENDLAISVSCARGAENETGKRLIVTLKNTSDETKVVPGKGLDGLGMWYLIAAGDGDTVVSLDSLSPFRPAATLDPAEHGIVLPPVKAHTLSLPLKVPLEPGIYRVRLGMGPISNPENLTSESGLLWTGEILSEWAVLRVQ